MNRVSFAVKIAFDLDIVYRQTDCRVVELYRVYMIMIQTYFVIYKL